MSKKRILVTGGLGFVGAEVTRSLLATENYIVKLAVSRGMGPAHGDNKRSYTLTGRLPDLDGWNAAVSDCDCVVHLAGRAHVLRESEKEPLAAFRHVNVEGTLSLARLARDSGVKRFIFISSIGVNGARTLDEPFNETSTPVPHADYALSKWEAEQALWNLVQGSDMELVIIRPPLVYAGYAPGNFARLLRLVKSGLPLPFAAVHNQRSMVALQNLVDFIVLCVEHPRAANELFVISDGSEISTARIIHLLAEGMGKSSKLFPVPPPLLYAGAKLLAKTNLYTQLCDSLIVDITKARRLLDWNPVIYPDNALRKAGHDFLHGQLKG